MAGPRPNSLPTSGGSSMRSRSTRCHLIGAKYGGSACMQFAADNSASPAVASPVRLAVPRQRQRQCRCHPHQGRAAMGGGDAARRGSAAMHRDAQVRWWTDELMGKTSARAAYGAASARIEMDLDAMLPRIGIPDPDGDDAGERLAVDRGGRTPCRAASPMRRSSCFPATASTSRRPRPMSARSTPCGSSTPCRRAATRPANPSRPREPEADHAQSAAISRWPPCRRRHLRCARRRAASRRAPSLLGGARRDGRAGADAGRGASRLSHPSRAHRGAVCAGRRRRPDRAHAHAASAAAVSSNPSSSTTAPAQRDGSGQGRWRRPIPTATPC